MQDEKMKILEMIQNGKITAEEGLELLNALNDSFNHQDSTASNVTNNSNRFLRIRVTSGENQKANVNIPLSIVKLTTKFANIGMKFIPEETREEMQKKGIDLSEINFEELIALVDQGLANGKLVDIDTDSPKNGHTKVEIYVD